MPLPFFFYINGIECSERGVRMRINRRVQISGGWMSCISALSALIMGCVFLAILTGLVLNETIGEENAGKIVSVIMLVCGFLCGVTGRLLGNNMQWIVLIGAAAVFACILLLGGLLFFGGSVTVPVIPLLMITIGNGLACAIKINKPQKHKVRKKRHR